MALPAVPLFIHIFCVATALFVDELRLFHLNEIPCGVLLKLLNERISLLLIAVLFKASSLSAVEEALLLVLFFPQSGFMTEEPDVLI